MPPTIDALLDVPIHLQNDADNCGEACAQMIVAFLTGHVPVSQNALAAAKTPTKKWATAPASLAAMINACLPAAARRYDRQPFGSATAAWAYADAAVRAGQPVAVLLWASILNSHWVVLKGRLPGAGGVVCRDPTPPRNILSGIAAIDHHAADDECRVKDQASSDAMGEIAAFHHFLARMQPAVLAPEKGLVIVVGPTLTPAELSGMAQPGPMPQPLALAPPPAPPTFAQAVQDGIAGLGLGDDEFWTSLRGHPDRVNSLTRKVHSATPGIDDYYLAPLLDQDGVPRAAAVLDGAARHLLRVRPLPQTYLARLFTPESGGAQRRLVWGAFEETGMSPFFPAEEVAVATGGVIAATGAAAHVPKVRFQRLLDGRRFDSLTPTS